MISLCFHNPRITFFPLPIISPLPNNTYLPQKIFQAVTSLQSCLTNNSYRFNTSARGGSGNGKKRLSWGVASSTQQYSSRRSAQGKRSKIERKRTKFRPQNFTLTTFLRRSFCPVKKAFSVVLHLSPLRNL